MAWVTPTNVATGDVLTASKWNQDVVENWNALGGAWTAYTPTWTNLTIGNGTQSNAFVSVGKFYVVRINVLFGSTTSVSGIPEATLPNAVSFHSGYHETFIFGEGGMRDFSAGTDFSAIIMRSASVASRVRFLSVNVAGTYARADTISSTVPMTWAVDDRIFATFAFEAA